jgi:hypothetical protein
MFNPKEIADKAAVIIAGFAVIDNGNGYSVYDLNDCEGVAIFLRDKQLLETNMDEICLSIAKKRLDQSLKYMSYA